MEKWAWAGMLRANEWVGPLNCSVCPHAGGGQPACGSGQGALRSITATPWMVSVSPLYFGLLTV